MRSIIALNLGDAHVEQGDVAAARQAFAEAIAGAQEIEDAGLLLVAMGSLGNFYFRQGDLDQAASVYREVARLGAEKGRPDGRLRPATGKALAHLANLLCEWNDLDAAFVTMKLHRVYNPKVYIKGEQYPLLLHKEIFLIKLHKRLLRF